MSEKCPRARFWVFQGSPFSSLAFLVTPLHPKEISRAVSFRGVKLRGNTNSACLFFTFIFSPFVVVGTRWTTRGICVRASKDDVYVCQRRTVLETRCALFCFSLLLSLYLSLVSRNRTFSKQPWRRDCPLAKDGSCTPGSRCAAVSCRLLYGYKEIVDSALLAMHAMPQQRREPNVFCLQSLAEPEAFWFSTVLEGHGRTSRALRP